MRKITQLFIDALHHLEQTGDVDKIATLFSETADISNPLAEHAGEGTIGARNFWASYRAAFESISSEFRSVVEGDGVTMLEWVSDGTTKEGRPVRYGGVSVFEHNDERLTAFRSYFDPSHLASSAADQTRALVEAQEDAAEQRGQNAGYQ